MNTHETGNIKIEFEEYNFDNAGQMMKFKGLGWIYTVTKNGNVISNYTCDEENITDDEATELDNIISDYRTKGGKFTPVVDKTLI